VNGPWAIPADPRITGVQDFALTALWICLCGARNRLRDTTCRACGDYKPEAHK